MHLMRQLSNPSPGVEALGQTGVRKPSTERRVRANVLVDAAGADVAFVTNLHAAEPGGRASVDGANVEVVAADDPDRHRASQPPRRVGASPLDRTSTQTASETPRAEASRGVGVPREYHINPEQRRVETKALLYQRLRRRVLST